MYTIKEAALRSGISVPLLRAWERRYGIVEPSRTAAGYRLYDDDSLDRLRAMRRLVDSGWTPSNAAAAILSGASADVAIPATDAAAGMGRESKRSAQPGAAVQRGDLIDSFVNAAIGFDSDHVERILDEMFATGSFETVADGQLLPALVALGEAWEDGRLAVAGEHAASHAVLRRLAAAYQAAGRSAPAVGALLVGLPPGGRHELGALAFSTAARRAGFPVLYLGSDLPIGDWVTTVEQTRAAAAVIGVPTRADVRSAVDVARALRTSRPELPILFGGGAAQLAVAKFAPAPAPAPVDDEGTDPDADTAGLPPVALPDGLAAAIAELGATIPRPA